MYANPPNFGSFSWLSNIFVVQFGGAFPPDVNGVFNCFCYLSVHSNWYLHLHTTAEYGGIFHKPHPKTSDSENCAQSLHGWCLPANWCMLTRLHACTEDAEWEQLGWWWVVSTSRNESKAKEMAAISFKEYSVPCLVLYLQHQSHSLLILIILDSAKKQDFDEADCARRPVCG